MTSFLCLPDPCVHFLHCLHFAPSCCMAEPQSKTKIFHNSKTSFKNLLGGALDFIDSSIFLVKERMDAYIGRLHLS